MIIYDEPAERYHANPALGSGLLRSFIKSPQLYRDKRDGFCPNAETPAMRFGTLCHLAILEPERFSTSVAIKPEGMSFATKDGKQWRDENASCEIISFAEHETMQRMVERMPVKIAAMLSGGAAEVTFRTTLAGLPAQCRADYWKGHSGTIYDLKTIKDVDDIDRSIYSRGYHIQARFYQRIVEAELGQMPQFKLIFVETAAPFRWRIAILDSDYAKIADEAIDEALAGIARCEKDGDWSDEQQGIMLASPPAWTQQIEQNEEGEISL